MFHFSQLKSIILIGRICPPTMISFIFSLDGISIFIKLFFFLVVSFQLKESPLFFLVKMSFLVFNLSKSLGKH